MSKTIKQKISIELQVKRINFLLKGELPQQRVKIYKKRADFYNGYLQAIEDIITDVLDSDYAKMGELFRRR